MKIGEKVIAKEDIPTRKLVSKNIDYIKKGTEGIVTADGFIRWNSNNITTDNIKVEGYDTKNIAGFIIDYLARGSYIFEEIEEATDIPKEDFKDRIEEALDEIF